MYKLAVEYFQEEFKLIGISTSLMPFKVALLINKKLKINLKRTRYDVIMNKNDLDFRLQLFKYEDITTNAVLYLAQNKAVSKVYSDMPKDSLFQMDKTIENYLIPSHKKVQYFLKIEDEDNRLHINNLVTSLNEIPQFISTFHIQNNQLKSSENLIFE